jgi:hypothetical protein
MRQQGFSDMITKRAEMDDFELDDDKSSYVRSEDWRRRFMIPQRGILLSVISECIAKKEYLGEDAEVGEIWFRVCVRALSIIKCLLISTG